MTGVPNSVAGRAVAAMVALLLSGAPRLLSEPHGDAGHRCRCPASARHDCSCPRCHARAALASPAEEASTNVPPCHRAKAVQGRADSQPAPRRTPSGPCLSSGCESGGWLVASAPLDLYTVPVTPVIAIVPTASALPAATALVRQHLAEPETPPPKPA